MVEVVQSEVQGSLRSEEVVEVEEALLKDCSRVEVVGEVEEQVTMRLMLAVVEVEVEQVAVRLAFLTREEAVVASPMQYCLVLALAVEVAS